MLLLCSCSLPPCCALTHGCCPPEGRELHLETKTDAFPHTGRQALVTIKHMTIMAGSDAVHSVTVLGTHHHEGFIPYNFWSKLEGGYANNVYRYWTQSPFVHVVGGCFIQIHLFLCLLFPNLFRIFAFPHSYSGSFNCRNPAFHLLLLNGYRRRWKAGRTPQKQKAGELWRKRGLGKGQKRSIEMEGWSLLYSQHVVSQATATVP